MAETFEGKSDGINKRHLGDAVPQSAEVRGSTCVRPCAVGDQRASQGRPPLGASCRVLNDQNHELFKE